MTFLCNEIDNRSDILLTFAMSKNTYPQKNYAMKYSYVFLLLLCVCLSCTQEKQSLLKLFDKKTEVASEEVRPSLKDSLISPTAFYIQGKYWFFSEPKLDTLILVYDAEAEAYQRILPKGQGPAEAASVEQLGYGGDAGCVCAYDQRLRRAFKVRLSGNLSGRLPVEVDSAEVYGSSVAYDGRLSFYEQMGKSKRFTVSGPDGEKGFGEELQVRGLSPEIASKLLQGSITLSPERKRLVWMSYMGDAYEIYDYSNPDNMQTVCSVACGVPDARNDGAVTQHVHIGVRHVTVGGEYIYALYIGKTLQEIIADGKQQESLHSNQVLVFDWEGNPIEVLVADKELYSIAYSEEDGCLYGIGLDDEFAYTVYKLE